MQLVVEVEHHIHLVQKFVRSHQRTAVGRAVGLVVILVGVAASDVAEVLVALAAAAAEQVQGRLDLHGQP